jgi:hypothetical protein
LLLDIRNFEPIFALVFLNIVGEHFHLLASLRTLGKCVFQLLHTLLLFVFGDFPPLFSVFTLIEALSHSSVWKNIYSFSILLAIGPVAEVGSAICMDVNTKAILLVGLIAAVVHSTILPLVGSLSIHEVILPLSVVEASVIPNVETEPMNLVVGPFAKILVTINPNVDTFTLLL